MGSSAHVKANVHIDNATVEYINGIIKCKRKASTVDPGAELMESAK